MLHRPLMPDELIEHKHDIDKHGEDLPEIAQLDAVDLPGTRGPSGRGHMRFGLAACGYSPGDRAASGGLIGAGGGAAIATAAGGNPLVGAPIGGAATSPNGINLGRPVWR
jgi:osmotically inducible lipoprotein OsmB